MKLQLAIPRGAEKPSPVGLVQNGDDPAAAAYDLMASDLLDLEAFRWGSDGVDGDVVRWGLGGRSCEPVGSEVRGQILGGIEGVVGVPARFASLNGDAWLGLTSRRVGWKVEGKYVVVKRSVVEGTRGGRRSYGKDLDKLIPVQGKLRHDDVCVGALVFAFVND